MAGHRWDLIEARWNGLAQRHGIPTLRGLPDRRRKLYASILAKQPDWWESVEREIPRLSEVGRGFVAFDWLLSHGNFTKFAEGNYRDARNGKKQEESPFMAALRESRADYDERIRNGTSRI